MKVVDVVIAKIFSISLSGDAQMGTGECHCITALIISTLALELYKCVNV